MTTLTTKEVLKMAIQAGMRLDKHNGGFVDASELKRFAKLVATNATEREREACAQTVLNIAGFKEYEFAANSIRARGEPTLRGEAT